MGGVWPLGRPWDNWHRPPPSIQATKSSLFLIIITPASASSSLLKAIRKIQENQIKYTFFANHGHSYFYDILAWGEIPMCLWQYLNLRESFKIYFIFCTSHLSGELLTIYFCRTDLFPPKGANTRAGNWNKDTFIPICQFELIFHRPCLFCWFPNFIWSL